MENEHRRGTNGRTADRPAFGAEVRQATSIFDTLREPEPSEMVDFSGVFPAIRLQPAPEPAAKPADESGAHGGRGIARAPVVVTPRQRSQSSRASRSRSRKKTALLYAKYRDVLVGDRVRGRRQGSGTRRRPWPVEKPLRERWAYLKLYGMERFGEVCVAIGLDSLWEQVSAWVLPRLRQLGDVWGLQYLRRSTLPVPGASNARKAWKLLPVLMLVNLALLLVVLLAMAAGILPRSLAGKASLSSSCRWHTVASGETLYAISASYHLAAATVAASNHLKSYGALHPGQHLCIPLAVPTLAAGAADALVAPNLIASGPAVHGPTEFIQFALPYAVSAHQQTGWPVSMILAQWALEHGWAVPGFTGYNWGNVGALPGEPTVASGGAPGAPALFAYAPTPQDGVNYYVAVAGLSYYSQVAPAASSGGPNAAAYALGASPWDAAHYTGDGNPGDSLITIMSDFNLYRYD